MSKNRGSYKHPSGVIGLPRSMLRSKEYKRLSCNARVLMIALQDVWRPHEPHIHYSARRAGEAIGKSHKTGAYALKELQEHKFIICEEESNWINGKARMYRLTWLSIQEKEPTNEWMTETKATHTLPMGNALVSYRVS